MPRNRITNIARYGRQRVSSVPKSTESPWCCLSKHSFPARRHRPISLEIITSKEMPLLQYLILPPVTSTSRLRFRPQHSSGDQSRSQTWEERFRLKRNFKDLLIHIRGETGECVQKLIPRIFRTGMEFLLKAEGINIMRVKDFQFHQLT